MRILVVCPHFTPDVAPTGDVMTRIVGELADRGHQLHVVTALPWYRDHAVEPEWSGRLARTEAVPWGSVTRLYPFPTDKSAIVARAAAFGGFTVLATAEAVARAGPADVVLAMSPPLTLGLTGWLAARRWRAPFVFNIQDVFPDVAVEVGAITNPKLIEAARRLEGFVYGRADAITVLSDDLAANVTAKLDGGSDAGEKVRVIPNFVDTEWIRPAPTENAYRREFGLEGRRVVMYAGNVGLSQPLDLLLHGARAFPDVVFVVNGSGTALPDLRQRAAGLGNVRFVDFQPRERLPEVLAAADVHLLLLRTNLARASVPSKLYSILAAGRPVLASVDAGSEVARMVERAQAGVAVPPEDPAAFVEALAPLLEHDDDCRAMGERGRRFVESWAAPSSVAESYEQLFEWVARNGGYRPVA